MRDSTCRTAVHYREGVDWDDGRKGQHFYDQRKQHDGPEDEQADFQQ